MKIIKKIRPAVNLKQDEMLHILGGANTNKADYCQCSSGSSDTNDNANYAEHCKCLGNDTDNTNEKKFCVCGGDPPPETNGSLCQPPTNSGAQCGSSNPSKGII